MSLLRISSGSGGVGGCGSSPAPVFGYHKRKIDKGTLGEISKIREELEELEDAADQGIRIMELCELADLYGALEAYLTKHHPDIKMVDLELMSSVTRRAFLSGHRK